MIDARFSKKANPNQWKQVFLRLFGDTRTVYIEDRTFWSRSWRYQRRHEEMYDADHKIVGKYFTVFIDDESELGYDRCKQAVIEWYEGKSVKYRLD